MVRKTPCSETSERIRYRGKTILVTMPCWNEEGKAGEGVKAVPKDLVDTICVVDNGSKDNTAEEAKQQGAIVISHPHNLGAGGGIRTGLSTEDTTVLTFWPYSRGTTKTTPTICSGR